MEMTSPVSNAYSDPRRIMKVTIFHDDEHTKIIISKLDITPEERKETSNTFTLLTPHNIFVLEKTNKVTNTTPYDIHSSEQTLPRHMRTKLAQPRANKI